MSIVCISLEDYEKYGCPNCNCINSCSSGGVSGRGTYPSRCLGCGQEFIVLSGITKSGFGFKISESAEGEDIFEYPESKPHPNPKPARVWKYKKPDRKPANGGEFFKSRGIGYDLAGFVESQEAGQRLLMMVVEVLNKQKPDSWLDYREDEPNWIQFKFQHSEFDLDKINNHPLVKNQGVITTQVLVEAKK